MRPQVLLAALFAAPCALANNTPQTLPFSQDWTDAGLITASDDWSGVPGIIGYRGDGLGMTNTDPQTILVEGNTTPVDVNANQTNPNTSTTGGVSEFAITDPVVAFQGSGTADAPHLVIHLNTTGSSNVRVRYNLRDIDGSGDNSVQQVALHYRVGGTGDYTNVPLAYVADASSGPNLATLVTPIDVMLPAAVDNQSLVELRIMTTDSTGSDEWIGVDDIMVTSGAVVGPPVVSIANAEVLEGNAGTAALTFNVTLNAAAPAGGTSFRVQTQDGTASAPSDYVAFDQVVMIAEGLMSTSFDVTVNGDTTVEPDETLTLLLSAPMNATLPLTAPVGTIRNDDVPVLEIHDLQGSGATTPRTANETIQTVDNVVTGVTTNGFTMQTPDARADVNPDTSQGIFVFTGAAPTVVLGQSVSVLGRIQEFPASPSTPGASATQISATTVTPGATGQPLPTPVAFDATRPNPNPATPSCAIEYECYEFMRVSVADGAINTGNQRFGTDPFAEVYATAANRAFREPGIEAPGLSGLPVYDLNPELFELDADKFGLPGGAIAGGSRYSAVGVLGYEFSGYELWPTELTITPAPLPRPVRVARATEARVGFLNLFRLYDLIDDPTRPPSDEPVPTPEVYSRQLEKHAQTIVGAMRAPDIVGVAECESLQALQDLADRIALVSGGTITYSAYLTEGNDIGGIDVGFLVRSNVVVNSVTQLGATTINPFDGSLLHDRPPLRLIGSVTVGANSLPLTVHVNHTRSLSGIDGGDGNRIRNKRLSQAQDIAQMVQTEQTADPSRPILIIGDLNAFEFSDGYVDVVGQMAGTADPAVNLLSAANITNPPMYVWTRKIAQPERYSFAFEGSVQTLDHALVSRAARRFVSGLAYSRANADAAVELNNDAMSNLRGSDHDGLVIFLDTDRIFEDDFQGVPR